MVDITDPLYLAMIGGRTPIKPKPMLDSCSGDKTALDGCDKSEEDAMYDAASMDDIETARLNEETVSAINEWLETDDLDDGETLADRLFALFVGIFDVNKNGELDDDENAIFDEILNGAWDYLTAKGVTDEDASALLNDFDANAAERVHDLLVSNAPSDQDAINADIDSFAWGDDQEPMFDSALGGMLKKLGGAFKKVFAIRKGKKVRINKRISGVARLTAKQKSAVRRLHSRVISATARMRRKKSMRLSRQMGLSGK